MPYRRQLDMNAVIIWFRRDLRLTDNPALNVAVKKGQPLIFLYIHSPEDEGEWQLGSAAKWWLHHSLLALDASLRERGHCLLIRCGPALDVLMDVIQQSAATSVLWNRRYEAAIMARDASIKSRLRTEGVYAESFNAALMVEPWEVCTRQGAPYRMFTPFWRNISEHAHHCQPVSIPDSFSLHTAETTPQWVTEKLSTLQLDDLKLLPKIPWDQQFYKHWRPGEQGARVQLQEFLDLAIGNYKRDRDYPDLPGTSRLSPHLAFGELSPRQIISAIHEKAGDDPGLIEKSETYVRELGWREFSSHLLFHYPQTTHQNLNSNFAAFPWAKVDKALLQAWRQGNTGIPIVDAGMRQLWQTGWMHNRVRMIVASFLTKNLRYHWRHGARWFWDTLVDADLANNTQGWQWAAGTGADAAPYFRIFNPTLQGERFDSMGLYVKRYVLELARIPEKFVHRPWLLKPNEQAALGIATTVYARPLVSLEKTRDAALAAYRSVRKTVAVEL